MAKKVIINESAIVNLIMEDFDKNDFMDLLKRDKNAERRIKEIVVDVINDLFRVLWQRHSAFDNELKR